MSVDCVWSVITSGRGCQYSMWGIVRRIADVNTAGITEVRSVITAVRDVVAAVQDVQSLTLEDDSDIVTTASRKYQHNNSH